MRARDALGRPVPAGSPDAVEPVSEEALPPAEAVALARRLLADGRAFSAHEVFEASWKAAPAAERELWQGLAQVCVGLTHLARGNAVGAARLLRRGAALLSGQRSAYGVDVPQVVADALQRASEIDAGHAGGPVRI
ncbi:MAG: uncharacterized protein QOI82_173 [Actinomycetota bacterium]|jgi:predicted metal-dependent hydrolase|nr:uncharacterized protein [Actinomycetota bacterium]